VPEVKVPRTRTRKAAEPVTEVAEAKTTRTRTRKATEPVEGTVAEVTVPRTRSAGVPQVMFSAPEPVISTTIEDAPAAPPARSRRTRSSRPAETSENS
jgi:hypothetical protein